MRTSYGLVVGLVLANAAACGGRKSESEAFVDSHCAEVAKCCARANLPTDGKACRDWLAPASSGGR